MGEDRHHGHVQLVVHLVNILVIIQIIIVIILVINVEIIVVRIVVIILVIILVIIVIIIAVINQLLILLCRYLLSIHTNLTVSVAKLKSSYSREIFLRFFLITTQKPSSR